MSSNVLFGGNLKKILLSLMVLGVVSSILGAGTFASFNAQTTNGNNTFKTGTLVLSNTKTSEAGASVVSPTCYSNGSGATDTNANASCATLITAAGMKPNDIYTATLTLKNEGSLDANAFNVFSSACATADAAGQTYHGTGDLCSKIQLYIQEVDGTGNDTTCLYGNTGTSCDFSDATRTLADFVTNHTTSNAGLAVHSNALTAGSSSYIRIGMKLPLDADNSYQGRTATVDFNWYIAQ